MSVSQSGQDNGLEGKEVDPLWNNTDHDVVLVSSDDVVFYVPSYHLLSQINALRDAIAISCEGSTTPSSGPPRAPPIHLSDPLAESAEAISFFLHIASGTAGTDFLLSTKSPFFREDAMIVRRLRGYLALWLDQQVPKLHHGVHLQALDVFVLAAMAGLDRVVLDVVRYAERGVFDRSEEYRPWGELKGGVAFHPSRFPLEAWKAIPSEYMCAWLRAQLLESDDPLAFNDETAPGHWEGGVWRAMVNILENIRGGHGSSGPISMDDKTFIDQELM